MDILLCHISESNPNSPYEFTGLFSLAATLEQAGYDARVYHGDRDGLAMHLAASNPAVIGFSCDYDNYPLVGEVSKNLAATRPVPMIAGGPQANALGEAFLRDSGCAYILRGEADYSIISLMDFLLRSHGDEAGIPGLAFLDEDGHFREGPAAAPIHDLDSLPRPAFHRSLHAGRKYGRFVFTGRGCPYKCAYCASGGRNGGIRLRDMADVLAEINATLERWPSLKYLVVMDDTFATSRRRMEDFCRGLRDIRKSRDVVWYCECHVGGLYRWRDIVPEMIDSGLYRLQIGAESGDQDVLCLYGKQVEVGEIADFVAYAATAGIPQLATNFIFGGPRERPGATENFIEKLLEAAPGVIDVSTGFLRAYPGTPIREYPERYGLELLDGDDVLTREDFPYVVPQGATPMEVMAARQRSNRLIRSVMRRLIADGRVPTAAVMRQFKAAFDYGMRSRWFEEIADDAMAYQYYYAMYVGENNGLDGPDAAVYPQRTFEFWRTVTSHRGIPVLDGKALAPLEYELLLQCAGKRDLAEIVDNLFQRFGRAYSDRQSFRDKVRELLADFTTNHWLTCYRFGDEW